MRLTIYIALLALVGCVKVDEGQTHAGQLKSLTKYEGGTGLADFRLEDGTRCVAFSGHGITCDWRHEGVEK